MLKDIEIEPPRSTDGDNKTDWVPMKDMLPIGSKGKGRADTTTSDSAKPAEVPAPSGTTTTGKRRRDDRSPSPPAVDEVSSSTDRGPYDDASHAVAAFLRGPPLPPEAGESPRQPPTNRQRLHSPDRDVKLPPQDETPVSQFPPPIESRQLSRESNVSSDYDSRASLSGFSSGSLNDRSSIATTVDTSPEETAGESVRPSVAVAGDPFSYMSSATGGAPQLSMYGTTDPFGPRFSSQHLPTSMTSWVPPPPGSSVGVAAWNPMLGPPPSMMLPMPASLSSSMSFPSALSSLARPPLSGLDGGDIGAPAQPVHPHAYVTFGAGMRQKEIDLFTADNALIGTDAVSGERVEGAVPYHIPM